MSWAGAAKGASTGATIGATIGTAVPVIGNAIGAGVGAVAGGLAGAYATRQKSFEKQQKKMLKDDLARMQAGELGLTEAEKQQKIAESTDTAGRNVAAQQMQMGQLAAANPFAAGKIQQAARAGSEQLADTGAQAARGADQLSLQIAQQEEERIRNALADQVKSDRKDRKDAEASSGETQASATAAIDVLKSSGVLG
jgi:hypothetical protein